MASVRRRIVIGALAIACLATFAAPAFAQAPTAQLKITKVAPSARRIALVVGISRYQFIPTLDNPKNDAGLMARTLRGLGFTLVGGGPQLDLDKPAFDRAVQQFGEQIAGAEVALFYYAGHGLQVRGANWLVPINANPTRETDVDFQMVDANLVLRQMEAAGTRLNLMILDACRNNPFGGRGLRAASGGLAQMQAPEGTLISYATQPGNVAADGQNGDSPFTKALSDTLQRPGLDVFRLFNEVGLQVKRATGGVQQPWVSTSPIDGDFYFTGASAPPATATSSATDRDALFWSSVKDSRDPAQIQAYLDQFPQGTFAGLARVVLDTLKKPQTAALPAQPAPAPPPPAAVPPTAASPSQVAVAAPAPGDLSGSWVGRGGNWTVRATIDDGKLSGQLECAATLAFRFSVKLGDGQRFEAWATRVAAGSGLQTQVKGVFPRLSIYGTFAPNGRGIGDDACSSHDIVLERAAGK